MQKPDPPKSAHEQLQQFLTAPVFPDNVDRTRTAANLALILRLGVVGVLIQSIAFTPQLIHVLALLMFFGQWMLLKRGAVRAAAFILVLSAWAGLMSSAVDSGGVQAVGYTGGGMLVLLLAGWMLHRRQLVTFYLLTILFGILMAWLEVNDALPPMRGNTTPVLALIAYSVFLLVAAGVAYITLRTIQRALDDARKELRERENAEAALRESEARFRIISSVTSDYTFTSQVNADGTLEHSLLTGAFEAITGYTAEEFLAIGGWRATVHPDDLAQDDHDMAQLRQNRRVSTELRVVRKDGAVRWVRVHAQPVWDAQQNRLVAINGGVRDITDQKRAAQALRESEERFRALVANSSDIITILQADGTISFESESTERALGYAPEALVGARAFDYVHPDDLAGIVALFAEKVQQPGASAVSEYRFRHAQGHWVYLESRATNLLHDPIIRGIVVNSRDVTERKQAEAALRESEQRYRALAANLPGSAVILFDHELRFVLVDGPEVERAGYSSDGMIGKTLYHALPEDFAKLAEPNMRAVLQGKHFAAELPFGDQVHRYNYVPLADRDGNVTYGMILAQNITDQKRAEAALRESERRYRSVVEAFPDFIVVTDYAGHVLYVNPEFEQRTGLTLEQTRQLGTGNMLVHPDDREIVANAIRALMRSEAEHTGLIENRVLLGNRVYWYRGVICKIDYEGQPGLLVITRDITNSRRAEEALKRSEAQLRALLDATTDIAFLMSIDGTFLTVNKATAEVLGMTVEQAIGTNNFDQLPPDLLQARMPYLDAVRQTGKPARFEDYGLTGWSDNSIYPVFASAGVVEAYAIYSRDINEQKRLEEAVRQYTSQLENLVDERTIALRRVNEQLELVLNNTADALAFADTNGDVRVSNPAFRAAFSQQGAQSIEKILWSLDSDEQRERVGAALLKVIYDCELQRVEVQLAAVDGKGSDLDLTLIPVSVGEEAARHGVLLSGHDITQLKELERFKARFVADAVHDLATPIAGLSTRLYLLQRNPERLADHVRALENQVRHLENLLEDLRTLSQMDRGQLLLKMEKANINVLVQRVYDTYEPVALGKQQALVLQMDQALPDVLLDPRQIERVLVNLVSNAINYTPENRTIRIETTAEETALVVSVADQGMGIGADDVSRVFERFYRTAEARQLVASGTGLGLAITKEIVELHAGSVTVSSTPGVGSTFSVRLPV